MKFSRIVLFAMFASCLEGCAHLQDLQACRPTRVAPDPFSDHVGWDHMSVDEVWCSDDALEDARIAREEREAHAGSGKLAEAKRDEEVPEGNVSISLQITGPTAEQTR